MSKKIGAAIDTTSLNPFSVHTDTASGSDAEKTPFDTYLPKNTNGEYILDDSESAPYTPKENEVVVNDIKSACDFADHFMEAHREQYLSSGSQDYRITADRLRELLQEGIWDIEFDYLGIHGSICCFGSKDISVCYEENEKTYHSVDDVMSDPEIFGKPLSEIAELLEMYQSW